MPGTSVTTKVVVVADDTAFVRDRFCTALERAGHKTIAIRSAAELLARVRADLVEGSRSGQRIEASAAVRGVAADTDRIPVAGL